MVRTLSALTVVAVVASAATGIAVNSARAQGTDLPDDVPDVADETNSSLEIEGDERAEASASALRWKLRFDSGAEVDTNIHRVERIKLIPDSPDVPTETAYE